MEVVGARKNGRARGRHARSPSFTHYFKAPATQAMMNIMYIIDKNVVTLPVMVVIITYLL